MAATLILDDSRHHFLISSLTFIMAVLVAQTRVESGVHSSVEVAYGGLLGALVTLAVFQVAAMSEEPGGQGGGGSRRRRMRRTRTTTSAPSSAPTDGREFEGVNVENAAYPLGVCAEKSALVAAVAAGYGPGQIAAIGINASPCGGCRQWLHEFRIPEVSFRRADGSIATYRADELLPDTWDFPDA